MEIKYRDVVLRDMMERDIDDEIRWNTVETEWALWDAPWEMEVELPKFEPEAFRQEAMQELGRPKDSLRWGFELDAFGVHIGSVNSYLIDENWDWIRLKDVKPGQKTYRTLGIEINDSRYWGKGLGKQALCAFIRYYLDQGCTELCIQTWSGNVRMIKCAEKLGFVECDREVGNREVRGGIYDGLTFQLDLAAFRRYLLEQNLQELQLSPEISKAILSAYLRRPQFYEREALQSYADRPFPICSRTPLERLAIWCCYLTQIRQSYQNMEIPYPVVRDTLGDISLRAGLYAKKHGKPGLSKEDVLWLRHIHSCELFRLGSLQYQLFHMVYLDKEGCGEEYMTFSPAQKRKLPQGAPVVNIHVPEGADICPEAVEESLKMAKAFLEHRFPNFCRGGFVCYSWLLYPGLKELLPEGSNILSFASRFEIIGQVSDPYGSDSVRRIYGKRCARKADYPQETALQRNALGSFSKLGMACGILDVTAV